VPVVSEHFCSPFKCYCKHCGSSLLFLLFQFAVCDGRLVLIALLFRHIATNIVKALVCVLRIETCVTTVIITPHLGCGLQSAQKAVYLMGSRIPPPGEGAVIFVGTSPGPL